VKAAFECLSRSFTASGRGRPPQIVASGSSRSASSPRSDGCWPSHAGLLDPTPPPRHL